MIEMVMSLPLGTNEELVAEMISALMYSRHNGDRDYDNYPLPLRGTYSDKRNSGSELNEVEWLLDADDVTIEWMESIDELKVILPIGETYFENHGDTATSYDARMEYFWEGDIADHALWRLWNEELHDMRTKLGAQKNA